MNNQDFNIKNENKKRIQEKIYLIIIIILIITFIVFIIWKKDVLFNKEETKVNENQNTTNEKIENIQVSEEEVKRAYYLLVPEGALYSDLNDKNLETMAFGTIDKNLYNDTKLSDLTNKQKLTMVLRYEDSINKFPICIGEEQSGTTLQMSSLGKKLFKDTSFLKNYTNNSNLEIDSYKITTDEKTLTIQSTNCGSIEQSSKDITKLLSYEVQGTKLVLTIGAAHLELDEVADDGNWYNNTYNIFDNNNIVQKHVTEIDFKKHNTFTAIFDLANNGLYFESIERNN